MESIRLAGHLLEQTAVNGFGLVDTARLVVLEPRLELCNERVLLRCARRRASEEPLADLGGASVIFPSATSCP